MKYNAVFWDFDGVWSKDRFYKSLIKTHPDVYAFIQTKVFGSANNGLVDKWMKAELNMDDVNRLIAFNTGIDFDLLTNIFLKDVSRMEIEVRHIPIIKKLKMNGVKVGMITNNMDVFSIVTTPRLKLLDLFDGQVFNSSDYGILKSEGLYDVVVESVAVPFSSSLLIDDSIKARTAFEAKGGHTYAYDTFEKFESWVRNNL